MTSDDEHQHTQLPCPEDQLPWYVTQRLPPETYAVVAAHVASCIDCQARIASLVELQQAMRTLSARTPAPRADLFALVESRIESAPAATPRNQRQSVVHAGVSLAGAWGELLWAQAKLLRRDLFWAPLLIVPLACSLLVLPQPWRQATDMVALLAVLISALGMAFLYGRQIDPAREIALATQTSPRLVLGARCLLVFGYDLLLNCGVALPMFAIQRIVTPSWFLANWLAPLCFLSAIALLLSVMVSANVAVMSCLALWGLRLLGGAQSILFGGVSHFPIAGWQELYASFWRETPLLLAAAAVAVLLAFLLLERKERFAR